MYISKFSAFNYRSLKQVIIRLENGKNVIVGKNNSGKSNIIRGIEILVGEKFPSYQNFTDNDFYSYEHVDEETGEIIEHIADNFYLEAELGGRDFDEDLIGSIKKKTAFSRIESTESLYQRKDNGDITINYDLFQSLDDIESRREVVVLEQFQRGGEKKTDWKTPAQVLAFLRTTRKLKLFFSKSRNDDEKAGFGLLCIQNDNTIWITHFLSKKLRDSLLTTTVVSALRSQKEDLRLVYYTWFGKLVMGLWEQNKGKVNPVTRNTYEDDIKEKSLDIRNFVNAVFDKDTAEIRKLLEGAIAHKTITFKFINDTQNELYKNVQLFVNDGIDRPLNEKGTGIQSAIIIALFSLYCNNYHNNSSLLITEEPELFLHPQARRVISAELDKFLVGNAEQPRQLIISTHSTEYLRNVEPYNITRVYKDATTNGSVAKQLANDVSGELTMEIKRWLWSNNTELFFADKVVLVEGGEVYLLPALVDKIISAKQVLDYANITVARVNGKGNFLTYAKMLDCFDIEYLVLGDLDCFRDEVGKFVAHYRADDLRDKVSAIQLAIAAMPVDYEAVADRLRKVPKNLDAQALQALFGAFISGTIERDNVELQNTLAFMQSRYTKGSALEAAIKTVGDEEFANVLTILRGYNVFIWSKGELEDYYTANAIRLSGGKDLKALQLSYLIPMAETAIEEYLQHVDELILLTNTIMPNIDNVVPKNDVLVEVAEEEDSLK